MKDCHELKEENRRLKRLLELMKTQLAKALEAVANHHKTVTR